MSALNFALLENTLIHTSDKRLESKSSCTCMSCGEEVYAKSNQFEHSTDSSCKFDNFDALELIAKKMLVSYKYLYIPTQYINGEYQHYIEFDRVELNTAIDGKDVDAIGYKDELKFVLMIGKDASKINLNEYVLELSIPRDDIWDFSNYTDTIQRLCDITVGEEGVKHKYWRHMPFELMQTYAYFNTEKDGVNLDHIEVDDLVLNIEELGTLQQGKASQDAQDWFWSKVSVWRSGVMCAWHGNLYAHKCRTCKKLGDSRCSLKFPVPAGTVVYQPSTQVEADIVPVNVVEVKYTEDLEF